MSCAQFTAAAIARAPAETPGAESCIHLNDCGAALMPQPVVEATKAHLELEALAAGTWTDD